jgi:hypothetical protein
MSSSSDRRLFKHLPPGPRAKILEYLQDPSLERWKRIRDIDISHGQTLFDMVDMLDISFPGDYPSMILIARTSKVAERRNDDLKALEM